LLGGDGQQEAPRASAERNRREHETLEHRLMAASGKEFASQTRTFTFALLGSFLTSTGVAVALVRAL
jgi:hypothetical protein